MTANCSYSAAEPEVGLRAGWVAEDVSVTVDGRDVEVDARTMAEIELRAAELAER